MADDIKLLPLEVRERAIELMLEMNDDPPEFLLTPEKAARWIDFEVYRQNWRAGRIANREDYSDHPDNSDYKPTDGHVWPHPEAWVGHRDNESSLAVWRALEEAGESPKDYWECPAGMRKREFAHHSRPEPGRPPRATAGGVIAVILASPLLLLGYAFAALFFLVPLYIAIAVFGESYTIVPDTQHELGTAGILLAVLAGWFFIRGIGKALLGRDTAS